MGTRTSTHIARFPVHSKLLVLSCGLTVISSVFLWIYNKFWRTRKIRQQFPKIVISKIIIMMQIVWETRCFLWSLHWNYTKTAALFEVLIFLQFDICHCCRRSSNNTTAATNLPLHKRTTFLKWNKANTIAGNTENSERTCGIFIDRMFLNSFLKPRFIPK